MFYIRFFVMVVSMARTGLAQCNDAPAPSITAAPGRVNVSVNGRAPDVPDAISLAQVLLTAVPESLRQIAATNLPAASAVLWSEFLDGSRPAWFVALPTDIQSYLVRQFTPNTASASPTLDIPSSIFAPSGTPPVTTDIPSSTPTATPVPSQSSNDLASSSGSVPTTVSTSRPPTTKFVTSIVTISGSSRTTSTTKASQSAIPDSPIAASQDPGMSRRTKIAIGVAVPLSVLAVAAFVFACCFLSRRRRRKRNARSTDPSPDFIPRSAFDQRSALVSWDETRALRDGGRYPSSSPSVDSLQGSASRSSSDENVRPEMSRKISPPNVLHTHTSKRGRGKRTSYQSLQSVPEDPEESGESSLSRSPPLNPNRISPIGLPAPVKSQIKRKPVGGSKRHSPSSLTGKHGLNRAKRVDSLGLLDEEADASYPENRYDVSPIQNTFANESPYLEDYGPEYSRGYNDDDNIFLGRQQSPVQGRPTYPKTEWPW